MDEVFRKNVILTVRLDDAPQMDLLATLLKVRSLVGNGATC